MTQIIGIVYILAMVILFIAFLIAWFRYRKQVRGYKKYGVLAGLILIVFEVFTVLMVGLESWPPLLLIALIIGDGFAFIRMMAYTIVGIHMSTLLGYHSFPLIQPSLKGPETEAVVETDDKNLDISQSDEAGQLHAYNGSLSSMGLEKSDESNQTTDIPQQSGLPKIDSKRYIAISIAAAISAVLYSIILFSLTSPDLSDIVKQKFGGDVPVTNNTQVIIGLLVVLEYAFVEEIVFRLGIQNFLAKIFKWREKKYWIAIFLTAILWTFGHTGVLEPNWVKLVQVFPFGLVLGWLYRQQGTESCIFTHAIFNVIMAGISPLL